MNKWMKKLTAALCAAVLMCGMAVTAYAGGGGEWGGLAPAGPPAPGTAEPGEGLPAGRVLWVRGAAAPWRTRCPPSPRPPPPQGGAPPPPFWPAAPPSLS